jgi:hypothetical protein
VFLVGMREIEMKRWSGSARTPCTLASLGLKGIVIILLAICLMGAANSTGASAAGATSSEANATLVAFSAMAISTTADQVVANQALAPRATGVNGNPWGYNFSCCRRMYSPPARFCSYFRCIPYFWNGRGYVVECRDGRYSKSGGIRGACSYHRGVWRALLRR